MTKGIAAQIDDLLKPLGFEMREAAWNRRVSPVIDVVTLQVDKASQEATVNIGVLDPVAYERCWNRPVSEFVEESSCTVHVRLGELVHARDYWWPIDQPGVAEDLIAKTASHGLSFLDRMHANGAMETFLAESRLVAKLRPPQTVYLAILKHERGDVAGACALLARFKTKALGMWKPKAVALLGEFACDPLKLEAPDSATVR